MQAILTHRGTKKTEFTESSVSKTLHVYLLMSEVEEHGQHRLLLDTEVHSWSCDTFFCKFYSSSDGLRQLGRKKKKINSIYYFSKKSLTNAKLTRAST